MARNYLCTSTTLKFYYGILLRKTWNDLAQSFYCNFNYQRTGVASVGFRFHVWQAGGAEWSRVNVHHSVVWPHSTCRYILRNARTLRVLRAQWRHFLMRRMRTSVAEIQWLLLLLLLWRHSGLTRWAEAAADVISVVRIAVRQSGVEARYCGCAESRRESRSEVSRCEAERNKQAPPSGRTRSIFWVNTICE